MITGPAELESSVVVAEIVSPTLVFVNVKESVGAEPAEPV